MILYSITSKTLQHSLCNRYMAKLRTRTPKFTITSLYSIKTEHEIMKFSVLVELSILQMLRVLNFLNICGDIIKKLSFTCNSNRCPETDENFIKLSKACLVRFSPWILTTVIALMKYCKGSSVSLLHIPICLYAEANPWNYCLKHREHPNLK